MDFKTCIWGGIQLLVHFPGKNETLKTGICPVFFSKVNQNRNAVGEKFFPRPSLAAGHRCCADLKNVRDSPGSSADELPDLSFVDV